MLTEKAVITTVKVTEDESILRFVRAAPIFLMARHPFNQRHLVAAVIEPFSPSSFHRNY
jgi:hypothetical protein